MTVEINDEDLKKRIVTARISGDVFDIDTTEIGNKAFYTRLERLLADNGYLDEVKKGAFAVTRPFTINLIGKGSEIITGYETHRLYPYGAVAKQMQLLDEGKVSNLPFPLQYTVSP